MGFSENQFAEVARRIRDRLRGAEKKPQALCEIVADLEQAQKDFHGLQYHQRTETLSVTTDPIVLEGVCFGPFEIQLDLRRLGDCDDAPYRVIAREPNPAPSDPHVTHPHVRANRLCPGEGGGPIGTALREGRVCDAFMVIRVVLQTYNPDSPYAPLEEWGGTACYECGIIAPPEEVCRCLQCGRHFCPECATVCTGAVCSWCGATSCLYCLAECPVCKESVCPDCMSPCPACGQEICRACLEGGGCPCVGPRKDAAVASDRTCRWCMGEEGDRDLRPCVRCGKYVCRECRDERGVCYFCLEWETPERADEEWGWGSPGPDRDEEVGGMLGEMVGLCSQMGLARGLLAMTNRYDLDPDIDAAHRRADEADDAWDDWMIEPDARRPLGERLGEGFRMLG